MPLPRLPRSDRGRRPRALALAVPLLLVAPASLDQRAALAQREVPKIDTICPFGYVDLFNGKCSTLGLMTYTLKPTEGKPCPEGWMNVGGKYCRLK